MSNQLRKTTLTHKNVMLEEEKVRKLVKHLNASSESEAIRAEIDDRLFADEVMKHVLQLRRRGTVQDAYKHEFSQKEGLPPPPQLRYTAALGF